MTKAFTAALMLAVMAGGAQAQDFRAENRVTVRPGTGEFSVLGDGGFGARGIWCAAADFARDRLGARGVDRLYVKQPRSRGVGEASSVVFTLQPGDLQPQQVLILGFSVKTAGASLSVGHAYSFCADTRLVRTR